MASDRYSSSTWALPSSPVEKFACMFVEDKSGRCLEWYAFDVSDDAEHNQSPPPPLPPPYCYHYGDLTCFHLDDKCGAVNLKPKVTRSIESGGGLEWAILGSSLETDETKTLYFLLDEIKRGKLWVPSSGIQLERIDLISSRPTFSSPDLEETWKCVPSPMLDRVCDVQTVVLGGKLYFFCGSLETEEERRKRKGKEEEEKDPWAVVYDPNLNKWEALPDPPCCPRWIESYLFSAATEVPTPYLAVGSVSDSLLQIYRLDTKVWELDGQFHTRHIFPEDKDLRGPAVAVDSRLYWYGMKSGCLGGYDLVTKMWYVGYLQIHDQDYDLDHLAPPFHPQLGHLGGGGGGGGEDNFCLLWVSLLPPQTEDQNRPSDSNDSDISRLHCMKFQVVNTGNLCPTRGFVPLEVSILSCQSYLVGGIKDFHGAVVVDGHVGYNSSAVAGMDSVDGARANWKDPELYKLFIDLCLKETTENGRNGGSLKKESWDRIRVTLNKEKNINLSQKQVKNQWEYLKSKYGEWSKIISKTGNGYDSVTNTINWSTKEWSDYIKANPNAKQFRYAGLQYANELRAIFGGVRATGRFSWGPSKEGYPTDDTQPELQTYINLEDCLETPSSPNDSTKPDNKWQKKNKIEDLDKQLLDALQTLQNSDGPTIEECNRILDEMELFDMSDPLYIVACSIFCESKAHREQWMLLQQKPQAVRKGWIQLNGKKLGLL